MKLHAIQVPLNFVIMFFYIDFFNILFFLALRNPHWKYIKLLHSFLQYSILLLSPSRHVSFSLKILIQREGQNYLKATQSL